MNSQEIRYSAGSSILSEGRNQDPYQDEDHEFDQYDGAHNSIERHVEYILVASFDIDRGSIMEHQYPGPISGDENMLAELMLPDQAHVRSQDWTVFFLHKDTSLDEENKEEKRKLNAFRRKQREMELRGESIDSLNFKDFEIDDEENNEMLSDNESEAEGPPLIYVLNLVNTKQDQAVKRGAICKAMAICTRHSFLHIYKPLLLLALEEYFRAPVVETLESLYNAVNSMDLSLMPKFTSLERQILQASDVKDMFVGKFALMIEQKKIEEQRKSHESMASSSPNRKDQYPLPRDTHEFESKVFYNTVPVPIKIPVAITPETVGDFSLVKLITTFSTPHSQSPQPFPVHSHLTTSGPMTHPIMVLLNALLTQKRIIFLGHNQPSGSVAEAVLASCALVSGGILRGFSRHSFPYTDLTKIDDLLKVPGFIAGVTNPAFAHKPEWWDLLCDLPTGRMKISSKIEPAPITKDGLMFLQQSGSFSKEITLFMNGDGRAHSANDPTGDVAFMESVLGVISNRQGEAAVRNKFRSWVHRFTQISAAFDEIVFGASRLKIGAPEIDKDIFHFGVTGHGLVWPDEAIKLKEIGSNIGRIEGWKQSRSYYTYVKDLVRQWQKGDCVRGIDLGYQIDRLRSLRLGDVGSGEIYLAICRAIERAGINPDEEDFENPIDNEDESPTEEDLDHDKLYRRAKARYDAINHLLCVMPESNGGLFYLSLGLFHKDAVVRLAMVGLFERIITHEAGKHFWFSLSKFAKLGFFRAQQESRSTL